MPTWFQGFRERQERRNRELAAREGFARWRALREATDRRDWLRAAWELAVRSENRARAEEIEPELLKAAAEAAQLYAAEDAENLRIFELIRRCQEQK